MAKQTINIGATANDKSGDPLRTAFDKVNQNFAELYNSVSAVVVVGATAPINPSVGDLWWNSVSGRMYVYFGTAWVDSSPVDGAGISSTNELVNGAYTTSLGANGVLTLPNGSIINGSTIRGVAGTGELNYTGITIGPNSNDAEKTWMWVDHANAYISTDNSANTWTFNDAGALTFPQGTTIATADGTDAFIIDGAVDKDIQIYTYSGPTPTAHGWTFGADGTLTLPGKIAFPQISGPTLELVEDTNLLIRSNASDGNANNTIRLANYVQGVASYGSDITLLKDRFTIGVNENKLWTFGADGRVTFPDTSTYNNSRLTGAVDSDLELEVKHRITVSAVESVGDAVGGMFTTDITNDDDITVVEAGWQLNAGTELAPEWIPVFEGIESNPGVYNILIAQIDLPVGFEFVQGSTYTFRNPTPVSKVWTINNQNGTLIAPGNAILSNETAPLGGGGTYRDFSIELPTPDESNEQRWTFSNDGAITFPNGDLNIVGNTISNYVAGEMGGSGSQLEVAPTKTVITNGVTSSLGGGGSGITSQALFEVSTNGILSSFQVINTLGEGEPSLTSEFLTELDNLNFKIGQRFTNDLGDGSEPLVAFSGWTFSTDAPGYTKTLTLPAGGAIAESTNTFNIIGLTPAGPTGVPSSISGGVASTNAFWDQNPLSNLATTLGSGTGLTVTVTQTEGVAIAIAIVNPGTGYTNGELISVTSGTANAMFYINTVDYNETEWTFGCTGALTFPDATVQTTAWAGGKVVAAPAHSYGETGDVAGMLAFDASYIYYCTADYVNNTTDIWKRTAHGAGTW
jgi:hypothetical protein